MASCRNTRRVTVEGSKRALLAVTTWPATENNRSTASLVADMVSGVDAAGCARGAGPGTAEAAAGLAGMHCEGRGNFD